MVIPFDLELAWEAQELSMGKILTRGGEEVLLVRDAREAIDKEKHIDYPIIGVKLVNDLSFISWTPEGIFWIGEENDNDLLYIEII